MAKTLKIRTSKKAYTSMQQLPLVPFSTPFEQKLDPTNRWVLLADALPWDELVNIYLRKLSNHKTGASNINPRVILGALMVKHLLNLSDEDTILTICENIYIQYFLGYDSFSTDAPFSPTLFVEVRKRLGVEEIEKMNVLIYQLSMVKISGKASKSEEDKIKDDEANAGSGESDSLPSERPSEAPAGRLLVDATACPQDIGFPTDIKLLNSSREELERMIDGLYDKDVHGSVKPRTYRKNARKSYLRIVQKRKKSKEEIRKGIGSQLRYVKRDITIVKRLLEKSVWKLSSRDEELLSTIEKVYAQQREMWKNKTHRVEDRIVSIYQPYVRPIVRGKEKASVEFGCKINVSLVNGYTFLDQLSWDAFNEGGYLMDSVERYKERHGYYPKEVLADQIYCNRENRRTLKALDINLLAKPLGRPAADYRQEWGNGERNPIEGKFGQGKLKYGLNKITARLKSTSESMVAMILLVMNLVRLAADAPYFFVSALWHAIRYVCTQIKRMNETVLTKNAGPNMILVKTY